MNSVSTQIKDSLLSLSHKVVKLTESVITVIIHYILFLPISILLDEVNRLCGKRPQLLAESNVSYLEKIC